MIHQHLWTVIHLYLRDHGALEFFAYLQYVVYFFVRTV